MFIFITDAPIKSFAIDVLAIGYFTIMFITISKFQVVNLNRKSTEHMWSLESNC